MTRKKAVPEPEESQPEELIKLMAATAEQIAQRPVPTRRRRKIAAEAMEDAFSKQDEQEPDWMVKGRKRARARAQQRMRAS